MGLLNVPAGKELPDDIYVVIEIPANAEPIKYEVDRSEERRVGKECRGRWWSRHSKKR